MVLTFSLMPQTFLKTGQKWHKNNNLFSTVQIFFTLCSLHNHRAWKKVHPFCKLDHIRENKSWILEILQRILMSFLINCFIIRIITVIMYMLFNNFSYFFVYMKLNS